MDNLERLTVAQEQFERDNITFATNLAMIDRVLKQHGVTYSLVGGLALNAILNGRVNPYRENGSVRDFDAVALAPNLAAIKAAQAELKALKVNEPLFPDTEGIEAVHFGQVNQRATEFLSSMVLEETPGGPQWYLVLDGLKTAFPPETMKIEQVSLNGVALPCFNAKTILYRYLIRGGEIKPKDEAKVRELYAFVRQLEKDYRAKKERTGPELEVSASNNTQFDQNILAPFPDDEAYRPYVNFADQVMEKYGWRIQMFTLFWQLDKLVGGKISGSERLHSLKHVFRK